MRVANENLPCTASQVLLVDSTHVQLLQSITNSSPGCLALKARSSLMRDCRYLSGNGLPHRGQRSSTPARIDCVVDRLTDSSRVVALTRRRLR